MEKQSKKTNPKFLKLESLRKKYNLKQSDMALLLGIGTSSYSHKENGRSSFSYDDIIKILWVLNKEAGKAGHELLTFEDVFLKEKWQISNGTLTLLNYKDKYKVWFDDLPECDKLREIRRLLGIDFFNKDYKYHKGNK